jgi:putative transposase
MPSTHLSLHYHLVFSTKNRLPMITKDWRASLHAYLGGIVKGINGVPLAIGGIEDHVHLLVGLRATHRLDYVLRDIKADSSLWVHEVVGRKHFEWQAGYLGVTVSPFQIERVKNYVLNQEEHHRRQSFQEEYLEMLKFSAIEYDERYVW